MSNGISLEKFRSQFTTSATGTTPHGGVYQTFINKTGAPTIKGTLVSFSSDEDNSVAVAEGNALNAIGVIYEGDIAVGDPVKVVTYGLAEVLLKDGTAAAAGNRCFISDTAGRMSQQASPPATLEEYAKGIGRAAAAKEAGTDILSLVQLTFS